MCECELVAINALCENGRKGDVQKHKKLNRKQADELGSFLKDRRKKRSRGHRQRAASEISPYLFGNFLRFQFNKQGEDLGTQL